MDKQTYNALKAAFVAKGTSLHGWCKSEGVHIQNARDALFGRWTGPASRALVEKIKAAAEQKG